MPDQNLPSSISGRHLGPDDIANHTFPSARKGLDPEAVRRFLAEVAAQIRDLRNERNEMRVSATSQRTAPAPEPQPLDEAVLTRVLGEETTRVLQTARESAGAIVSKAEGRAAELIAGAESLAQTRRKEADSAVLALTERAKNDAAALIDKTKSEGRQMIEEAREARRRVLADLAERRRVLLVQLEQIRVGKESMIAVVESVASNVANSIDAVRAQLTGAEESAQVAAEHAAGELDAAIGNGEDIDAIVAEALAKLPRSGEEAVFTSFAGREPNADEAKVFDIERERNPRPAIHVGGPAVLSSEIIVTGPISSAEHEPSGSGSPRIPDRTPTVGGHQRTATPAKSAVAPKEDVPEKVAASPVPGDSTPITSDKVDAKSADVTPIASQVAGAVQIDSPQADTAQADTAQGDRVDRDPVHVESGAASKDASPVDQLFARIRASRESRVADAQRVLSDGDGGSTRRSSQSRRRAKNAIADEIIDVTSPSVTEADVSEREPVGAVHKPDDEPSGTESSGKSSGDASKSAARDALLQPAHAELSRALKRAFREEQNLVLDALRNRKKTAALPSFLPGEATRVRLIEAALPGVGAAYIGGEEFLSPGLHKNKRSAAENEAISEISGRLAQEILDALHARLLPAFSKEPDQEVDVVEAVGMVFRDWKAARVESLAFDYAIDAFGAGTIAFASAKKFALVWNFDDGGAECPDCDDNGVAGAVVAGESFPTGHRHPPVHPGCRCFLSS